MNVYLIWLEWPERCFRICAEDLCFLKSLVPRGSRIIRAKSERSFLRWLPEATHAVVWNFSPAWFEKAPRLKMLATPAAGREFVPERGPKGVRIHFGTFHGQIMSESVAAFMFAWNRGLFRLQTEEARRQGPWPRTWLSDKCARIGGTKAVIVGFGHVGRAIGELLERLDVQVTGLTRHGAFRGARNPKRLPARDVSSALGSADWLVMALPSTTGTDDYLNATLIGKLPRKCVVINVGRGNAIDERALCRALKSGRLAGACLDVRKHEPSATVLETAGYVPELADLPNCIVTPHASAFDAQYIRLCFKELKDERLV